MLTTGPVFEWLMVNKISYLPAPCFVLMTEQGIPHGLDVMSLSVGYSESLCSQNCNLDSDKQRLPDNLFWYSPTMLLCNKGTGPSLHD
jgi:hypothetical protein